MRFKWGLFCAAAALFVPSTAFPTENLVVKLFVTTVKQDSPVQVVGFKYPDGWSRSCNQAAQVPSSKATYKLPHRPLMNWRIVSAFVSRIASITRFPRESRTAIEIVA